MKWFQPNGTMQRGHADHSSYLWLALLAALVLPAHSEVRLPRMFGDHMVLQRDKPVSVWGWAAPGENISVEINDRKFTGTASQNGEWKIVLPPMAAGGPFKLVVRGENVLTFEDVMMGEVWICSGQSNMEMGIKECAGAEEAIAAANHPHIRLFSVPNRWTPLPQTDIESNWRVCSPATIVEEGWGGFSACAYYFGNKLHEELRVPIGLVDVTWGGTRIQSWTPLEGFASVPELKPEYEAAKLADPRTPEHETRLKQFLADTEDWLAKARAAMTKRIPVPPMPSHPEELRAPDQVQAATALFNGMIHPLRPFTIAGACWYQGENNINDGLKYGYRMQALIQGWRRVWDQGDFPFNFVQLAPYNYGGRPEGEAELWEAQASALSLPNTGMAVINDIGDLHDIHPRNKRSVGERLARVALAKTYGKTNLAYSGPTFRSLQIEQNKLRINFDHAAGLTTRDRKAPTWFELIDADQGGFVKADAKIDGSSVLLSAVETPHPVAMRFAWSMLAEPNLINGDGLPTSAFRAGTVPKRDSLVMTIPEARDFETVYDLDCSRVKPKIEYTVDRTAEIQGPFDRIAYFLELQLTNGQTQYVYVSLNAFTADVRKIGVPTAESGARFQQTVDDMNVYTSVAGVATGTHSSGNVEFWPGNYSPENGTHVPGASAQVFDFGDSPANPSDGYGSMQIHNFKAQQTVFAFNHWREGEDADLGIGNNPSGNPDWTFSRSARTYTSKRLRVLVRLAHPDRTKTRQ